jgi:putative ABC transport system permease protein
MQLRHIAWSSLNRRKGRFVFLLVALTLGIGTVIALVSLSTAMRTAVSDELDRFGANIIITPRSRSINLAYGGLEVGGVAVDTSDLTSDDAGRVRTIPTKRNISAVAPKLVGTIEIEGQRVVLIGVDFRQERRVKSWWTVDGRFATTPAEVMLGAEVSQTLGKRTGDTLTIGDSPRRVTAVVTPTGSIDDQAVFADLGSVQLHLGQPDAVSHIEVSALCRECPIEDIVREIGAVLPHARVAPIRQAVAARERAVLQFTRFAYVVSIVVLLVGGLVVMTTMMASVTERTQEIGILRAVGFRRTQVARVILLEALGVTAVGGLLGWLAGTFAARALGPALAELTTPIPADARLLFVAIALAVLLGTGGGTYPAMRAARMDPSLALRHI